MAGMVPAEKCHLTRAEEQQHCPAIAALAGRHGEKPEPARSGCRTRMAVCLLHDMFLCYISSIASDWLRYHETMKQVQHNSSKAH